MEGTNMRSTDQYCYRVPHKRRPPSGATLALRLGANCRGLELRVWEFFCLGIWGCVFGFYRQIVGPKVSLGARVRNKRFWPFKCHPSTHTIHGVFGGVCNRAAATRYIPRCKTACNRTPTSPGWLRIPVCVCKPVISHGCQSDFCRAGFRLTYLRSQLESLPFSRKDRIS